MNEVRMVTAEYIQKEIQKSNDALGFETLWVGGVKHIADFVKLIFVMNCVSRNCIFLLVLVTSIQDKIIIILIIPWNMWQSVYILETQQQIKIAFMNKWRWD
jgi:hypothetical protein